MLRVAETVLYSPQTLVIKCRHLYRVAVAECLRVEEEEASIAGIGKMTLQSPPELANVTASSERNVRDAELKTASPLIQGANNESSKAASREKIGVFQSHNDDNQTSVLSPWWRELVSRVMAVTDGELSSVAPSAESVQQGHAAGYAGVGLPGWQRKQPSRCKNKR